MFTSLCTDVNCSPVYVVKWGKARRETVFPVCQHLCEKKRGKNTTTRVCGHTCEGLPSTDGTDGLREAGRPSGRKRFHCLSFGSFWVWSLVNSLAIQITTFGFSRECGEASTQADSLIHTLCTNSPPGAFLMSAMALRSSWSDMDPGTILSSGHPPPFQSHPFQNEIGSVSSDLVKLSYTYWLCFVLCRIRVDLFW